MENQTNSGFSLEHSALWNGVLIPVEIEPEADGEVSPVQREALRLCQLLPLDILETAAPAVVQNYEVYREMLGDDDCPPLARPSDVWKQVHATRFSIPPHEGHPIPTFFLDAEIDWDVEHGLTVRFKNGHADESNQQGEIGIDD